MADPNTKGPHQGQPVLSVGAALSEAKAVMVLLHGRGAGAEDILSVSAELRQQQVAYLAPQAQGFTWYPYRFLAPLEENEPWLSSALQVISDLIEEVGRKGFPPERLILGGFSQGACLCLEFAARHARRYAAVIGWSGGLIGPPGTPRDYSGSLGGTPVFLGCSDRDPHIPLERVQESTDALQRLGGEVTERIYPGMGHTINEDEIEFTRSLLARVVSPEARDR
jgi:predicted esterase